MKKRLISMTALILALVMIFGMSAFAAKSISAYNSNVNLQTMENFAKDAIVWYTNNDDRVPTVPSSIEEYDKAVEQSAKLFPGGKIISMFGVRMTVIPNEEIAAGKEIEMKIPGVIPGEGYALLCYVNGQWKVIETKADADGILKGVFYNRYFTLAIVQKNAGATSPKTGQTGDLSYLLTMTALCGAAIVSFKKSKEV